MKFLFLLFFLFRKFESNQIKAKMAIMGKAFLTVVCIYLILIASNQRGATAKPITTNHKCKSLCESNKTTCRSDPNTTIDKLTNCSKAHKRCRKLCEEA